MAEAEYERQFRRPPDHRPTGAERGGLGLGEMMTLLARAVRAVRPTRRPHARSLTKGGDVDRHRCHHPRRVRDGRPPTLPAERGSTRRTGSTTAKDVQWLLDARRSTPAASTPSPAPRPVRRHQHPAGRTVLLVDLHARRRPHRGSPSAKPAPHIDGPEPRHRLHALAAGLACCSSPPTSNPLGRRPPPARGRLALVGGQRPHLPLRRPPCPATRSRSTSTWRTAAHC